MKFKLAAAVLSFLLVTTPYAFAQTPDTDSPDTGSPYERSGIEFMIGDVIAPQQDNERLFRQIFELIRDQHVEEKSEEQLTYGAIDGMIKLLDKHSSYMPPVSLEEMLENQSGEFSGIGAEVSFDDDKKMITLDRIMPRSPAMDSGLKDGDKVWQINDILTKDLEGERPIIEAVTLIRGITGTDVKLYIERDGENLAEPVTVTRGIIEVETVKTRVLDGDIAYLTLRQFGDKAVTEVEEAIQGFAHDPDVIYHGLIFDLRDNPGGLLYAAIVISDMFLDEGVIVSTRPRAGLGEEEFTRARIGQIVPKDFPLVILINQNSASASEIVAGTLQDHERAVIVGKTSYGKGSVQTIIPLINGGALRLTTAKYHTASGKTPHGVGISPDVEVELPENFYKDMSYAERRIVVDPQMVEAIKQVRKIISDQETQ